jgi:hypothetical protein
MTTNTQPSGTLTPLGESPENRCLYLMLALLALLLVHPFFSGGPAGRTLLLVLNSGTLVAGIYAVSEDRRHTMIALGLGLFWFGLAWSDHALGVGVTRVPTLVVAVVFYAFAVVRILTFVLSNSQVTKGKIYGAVSVYLLLGVAWASCYSLLYAVQPEAFFVDAAHSTGGPLRLVDFLYFSFVTLTTLGYGDITPLSAQARSLSMMEAVCGVLYIAVLVARLVGVYRPESDRHQRSTVD